MQEAGHKAEEIQKVGYRARQKARAQPRHVHMGHGWQTAIHYLHFRVCACVRKYVRACACMRVHEWVRRQIVCNAPHLRDIVFKCICNTHQCWVSHTCACFKRFCCCPAWCLGWIWCNSKKPVSKRFGRLSAVFSVLGLTALVSILIYFVVVPGVKVDMEHCPQFSSV